MAPRRDRDLTFDPTGDVLLILTENKSNRPNQQLEAKVSSRHLALASEVFRVMFDGGFKERIGPGQPIRRVPLPDDDAKAMMILLGILHGLSGRVPKTIRLRTFVKIGILVDKYQLQEAVEVYVDRWFQPLWDAAEYETCAGLAKWIFLTSAFNLDSEFKMMTWYAIYRGDQSIYDHGLPLPAAICTEIDRQRTTALEGLLDYLRDLIKRYTARGRPQCSELCDALVLGDLIKKLTRVGLYPVPEVIDASWTLETLFWKVKHLKFLSLCQSAAALPDQDPSGSELEWVPEARDCNLTCAIRAKVNELTAETHGLELPFETTRRRRSDR
ncbi:hypothetical protein H2200_009953 [Cladophialophora chaetospira]|uniref:BTB domain-containing protein n=1 Tax=Cladophialophora chaetospira TaxID=386627 RepID=A0AA38X1X1_9EURO|nr:hypothetical protein H2200_009953 [Cladophialophora chaetospira]